MDSAQLPNYLLSNRKRLGLSQADVAYLLSAESGEKVCRHERFLREPNLWTGLAYEAIYKRTASELFSGLYRKVEDRVAARAKSLVGIIAGRKPSRTNAQKCRVLLDLASMGTARV